MVGVVGRVGPLGQVTELILKVVKMDGCTRGKGCSSCWGQFGDVMSISGQEIKLDEYVGGWLHLMESLQCQNKV